MADSDNKVRSNPTEQTQPETGEAKRDPRAAGPSDPSQPVRDDRDLKHNPDANPDAITGAPGSHPVGAGIGAAGGAAAGAAIGSAVPGAGTVIGGAVGAIIGGVAGGYAGKGIAEAINPSDEAAYWRDAYPTRPYYDANVPYSEYEPAYRYGWESRCREGERPCKFADVEPELRQNWESNRGASRLDWDRASLAAEDAWRRVDERHRQ